MTEAASEKPGPTDTRSATTVHELQKAAAWISLVAALALVVLLVQPILIIFSGLVLAAMLDGGARLLGRVLPIPRAWRLLITCLGVAAFIAWTIYFAGSQIADQFETLRRVIEAQINRGLAWGHAHGIVPEDSGRAIGNELMGSFGKLTAWVGSALGVVSSVTMILVLGVFLAAEPRLYERGFAWLLPMEKRERFYETSDRMGYTLRRLMFGRLVGMAVEGLGTGIAASLAGIPMAALLGILTGLLAFLPNIGAVVSGVLLVLVGFSAGFDTGIWAIVIYFAVQTIDGYLIVPWVARRSVDLAPALVLGAQLLFGTLFGFLGLMLADPIVAMIKVYLEQRSKRD